MPSEDCTILWDQAFAGLANIGYTGPLVIEAFDRALPELAAAARIWRPLFADREDVPRHGLAFMKSLARKHGLA